MHVTETGPAFHTQILYGNLAPEGSVAKITGKEGLRFRGPARVYDSEEDMLATVGEDPQQLKARDLGSSGDPRRSQDAQNAALPASRRTGISQGAVPVALARSQHQLQAHLMRSFQDSVGETSVPRDG